MTQPSGPDALATTVLRRLEVAGGTVAVAESLTGGLVLAALTSVAGASRVVRGGIVAYATDLKAQLLGVDGALVARTGAVDPEVARAMAVGARARFGATWAVATTGEAGPESASGQPVGTVHVAVVGPGVDRVRALRLAGDRAAVRAASVTAALELLADALPGGPNG